MNAPFATGLISDSFILSVDTATLGGSVFVGRGERLLATRLGDPNVSHSNSLLRDINDSLREAAVALQDIDVFACAVGPGSFTGLRIGIATVKALSATLDRPTMGVPTLHAVAHAAGPSPVTVALLPAGRGEVFAQMFSVSEAGAVVEKDAPGHLSPMKLIERYGNFEDVTWAGGGAHAESDLLREHARQRGFQFIKMAGNDTGELPAGWRLAGRTENLARHVAALALRAFDEGKVQSAQTLNAIYVRPSDPELKERCQ
jgi:tRNA threonylcarbamoyladenosine biosynthesis protein TsaB